MKNSIFKGLSFGLTSGIITTLGVIVGLYSWTGSKLVVLGGILSVAVADSFSDALGIHVSEEADKRNSHERVWAATLSTFFSKLLFSLTFVIPFLFLELYEAMFVSVVWGLMLLGWLSYFIARKNSKSPFKVVVEHLVIAVFVIVVTHYLGEIISKVFV